ncbi:hypothetical protein [uncultured Polaribacter sp.]|uniref:hypothetical protein n=1 Tax=uncultured Polaribacter sp. TaxID=174711 RepID=UPI0026296A13|nr:hypothetical protein [uncultured Polaribacter sp.]
MMQNSKLFLVFIMLFLASCNLQEAPKNIAPSPNFKIGKNGFEKKLQTIFDFEKLSVGTTVTRNLGISKTGLNLTFKVIDLKLMSDERIYKHSEVIKFETKQNLLKLNTYDFLTIIFKEEIKEGDFTKSSTIKIKKQLN